MLKQKNTLLQGNIGLAISIAYFTSIGCIVSIPLNDIQGYDLAIDFGDCELKSVQVKTTRCVERGKYKVELRTGGKSFEDNKSDYLFVVDGDNNRYLIPRKFITSKNAISLGEQYSQYIV